VVAAVVRLLMAAGVGAVGHLPMDAAAVVDAPPPTGAVVDANINFLI
jgi:hypothetical protein